MVAEARRIKMAVEYQNQIQETIQRKASREIMDESDYEYDDDTSEQSDPPWIKEYPFDDLDEDSQENSTQPMQPTLTPLEATAELTKIRPVHSKPSDLKHLLECKADPNMPLEAGNITPLQKVMSFAPMKYVVEMRSLLLGYGATESEQDKSRWELRKQADFAERIRIDNDKNIDKDYNPWSATTDMEY
jgi:hypothetical protein